MLLAIIYFICTTGTELKLTVTMATSYMHNFTYHIGTQDNINDDNHSSNDCSDVAPYGAVLGAIFGSFVIITFMIMVCRLYIRYTYNRRIHQTSTIIIDPQQILKVRPI